MRLSTPMAAFVVATLVSAAPASAQEHVLTGQWIASVNGQQIVLTLNADGSSEALGVRGRWQAQGQVVLIAGDGWQFQGVLQGGQLVFDHNGQKIVYTRSGGGASVSAPATGAPFRPEKTLPGRTMTPERTTMKLTMPDGWTGAWTLAGKTAIYSITVPGMQGKAMIGASAKVLGNERSLPMTTLLAQGAILLWGQGAAATPFLTETFTVDGHPAGRIIHRATVPHPATGQPVQAEGYLGLVLIDEWAFMFAGLYDVKDTGALRPGLDTMLASLTGTPPPRDRAMEARIAGCWESGKYTSPTKEKGGGGTSAYVTLRPDGTYTRKSMVQAASPKLKDTLPSRPEVDVTGQFSEQGTFAVHGQLITWMPSGEVSYSNLVAHDPAGALIIDGKTWIRCL
jgi:hypothetical protein